jgi:hypothetical protein
MKTSSAGPAAASGAHAKAAAANPAPIDTPSFMGSFIAIPSLRNLWIERIVARQQIAGAGSMDLARRRRLAAKARMKCAYSAVSGVTLRLLSLMTIFARRYLKYGSSNVDQAWSS